MRQNPQKKCGGIQKSILKPHNVKKQYMSFGKSPDDENISGADQKLSQHHLDPNNDQPKTARIRQASFSDYFLHTDKTDEDAS